MFQMVVFDLVSLTDPYSREDQAHFAKWYANLSQLLYYPVLFICHSDALCPGNSSSVAWAFVVLNTTREGPEHTTDLGGAHAQPSACTLPLFHAPLTVENQPPGGPPGYVSNDGHHFTCKNPALLQPAFHV